MILKKKIGKKFFLDPIKSSEYDFNRDFACLTPIHPHTTQVADPQAHNICKTYRLLSQECLGGFPKFFFCLKAVNKLHQIHPSNAILDCIGFFRAHSLFFPINEVCKG